ncbi:hypothetical protein [Alicyclobacillus sp. ALC3]|uniref:hypothetical protein n=1 Tax=Alicyclobacillus sp. ALC3 TaxID=2796143 RepID=UPI002378D0F9|nr:hypothetical protein [Alicyclobacillus sp. ALC3]WDL95901.1 hypothetical protein JC200_16295 [Alicyclobacillus sp. ALC3]
MAWSKTVVTTLGFIVGEGIYFVLISHVWKVVGWKPTTAEIFVSLLTFVTGCAFAWSYLANEMTYNREVTFAVTVSIILFAVVLVCCQIDQQIYLNSSGFVYYLVSGAKFPGEERVGLELKGTFQLLLSGVVFVVSYRLFANRRHKISVGKESA